MSREKDPYEARLRRIVRDSVWLMSILETVRYCDPPDWHVGGGVLYKLVWNRLHGYTETAYGGDVDVVFFDQGISVRYGNTPLNEISRRSGRIYAGMPKIWPPFISGTRIRSDTPCRR
jgi:hypothetical protein